MIEIYKKLEQVQMQDLRKCKKCNLPETYETIEYDEKNICNYVMMLNIRIQK